MKNVNRFVVAMVAMVVVLGASVPAYAQLGPWLQFADQDGPLLAQADTSEKTDDAAPPATSENRLLTPEEKAFIAERYAAINAIIVEIQEILSTIQDTTAWKAKKDTIIEKAHQVDDLLREIQVKIHENDRRVEQENVLAEAPKRFDELFNAWEAKLQDPNALRGLFIVVGESYARENVTRSETITDIEAAVEKTRKLHTTINEERIFFKGQLDFWWRSRLSTNPDVLSWRDELLDAARALERAIADDVLIMELASGSGRQTWLHIVQFGVVDDIELPRAREITPEIPVDLDKTAARMCIDFTDNLRQLQHKRHVCREQFFAALVRDLSVQCIELQDKLAAEENQQPAAQREEETTPASFSPQRDEK